MSKGSVSGLKDENTFKLDNRANINIDYLLRKDNDKYKDFNEDGVLGLGFDVEKDFSNVINELHKDKFISSSRYSLFLSDDDSKILYGDFSTSSNIGFVYKQMGYCTTNNNKCVVSGIEINKKAVNIDSYAIFDTMTPYLTIPVTDFKIFRKSVLNEAECSLNEQHQILCKCTNETKFIDLKLMIGNLPFVIRTQNLFHYFPDHDYQCRFDIFVDMDSFDTWILGTSVLKDSLLSFDILGKKIGYIQNTKGLNSLLVKEEFFTEYQEYTGDSKLGYIIAVVVIIILMYGLVNFAQNKITHENRLDDSNNMELIQSKFNTDKYDFDKSFKDEEKK